MALKRVVDTNIYFQIHDKYKTTLVADCAQVKGLRFAKGHLLHYQL